MANIQAEALARIEHKLDLLVRGTAVANPLMHLTPVGSPDHICPLCHEDVTYRIDALEQTLTRICKCSTNMQSPINFQQFAPLEKTENTDNGE